MAPLFSASHGSRPRRHRVRANHPPFIVNSTNLNAHGTHFCRGMPDPRETCTSSTRPDAGENPTPRKLAAMADRPGTSRGTNAPTHAQPPVTTNTQRSDGASTRMRTGTSRSHHCDQSPNDTPLTTGIHHSRVRTATHRHRVRLNAKEHGCWVVHQ